MLALLALLLAAQPAAATPTVDVFFEGPPDEDHADILYLVYVSKPGTVRVYLPLNSEVRGVYWFAADELRTVDGLALPPRSEWGRHEVRDWRLTSEGLEWRDRLYAPVGDDWPVRVPIDGIPETVRNAFAGLLERGYADIPVLEARVDPGLLVVEVRARLVSNHLLMYLVPGYEFNAATYESDNRHSYYLEPTDYGFVIEQGVNVPTFEPALVAFGLEDLREYEYWPVKVNYWGWEREGPPYRYHLFPALVPLPVRRRRLAVLLAAIALLPAAAHANPRILPPSPPPPVFVSQITVLDGGMKGNLHEVHVFVRLWPGTEGTVYVPREARIETAAVVPADAVLSSATAGDVRAWCERNHSPAPETAETTFELPEEVSVITWWDEEFRTRRDLFLESRLGRAMKPLLDGVLALRVRADDDSFLYLDLLVPAGWRYLPLGVTSSLLLHPFGDPIPALVRAGDRWYASYANSELLRSLHPDLFLLLLNVEGSWGTRLNTEQLWEKELRRLSEGPETVIVRSVRGDEVLVDVVATVPEIPLPAGSKILKYGTVPRDAYRDAYTGVLAPGFQPVQYRVVREGEMNVPDIGTVEYRVVRVDVSPDRLLVIRAIVPMKNGKLVIPVVGGGTVLGSSYYDRKEAGGFEWLVVEEFEDLKGFRKFEPRRGWDRRPKPLEVLVGLLLTPLLLYWVSTAFGGDTGSPLTVVANFLGELVVDSLPSPLREALKPVTRLVGYCVIFLLGALTVAQGSLPL